MYWQLVNKGQKEGLSELAILKSECKVLLKDWSKNLESITIG